MSDAKAESVARWTHEPPETSGVYAICCTSPTNRRRCVASLYRASRGRAAWCDHPYSDWPQFLANGWLRWSVPIKLPPMPKRSLASSDTHDGEKARKD